MSDKTYLLINASKDEETATDIGSSNRIRYLTHRRIRIVVGILALLFTVVLCIILLAVFLTLRGNDEADCLTPGVCNTKILDYIDSSVNPCEDFYNFSCGNWPRLSSDDLAIQGEWDRFAELTLDNVQHIVTYLSQPVRASDPAAIKKSKYAFNACSDSDYIQANFKKYLLQFMRETGGWKDAGINPVEAWGINTSLANEHSLGSTAFFSSSVLPNEKNSSEAIIYVGQAGLTLAAPEMYYDVNGKDFLDLIKLIKNYLQVLPSHIANSDALAQGIADYERSLALASLTQEELRNQTATYNPMKLAIFSNIFDLDWELYFNTLFGNVGLYPSFTTETVVIVQTVEYFQNITSLLQNSSATVNYAKWRLMQEQISKASLLLNADWDILSNVKFPLLAKDTSLVCAQLVDQAMPLAVARPFVEEFITDQIRNTMNETIDKIEEAFKQRIMTKTWLDKTTKDRCADKVNGITRKIAYPDFIKIDNELDAYYKKLNISSTTNYFSMVQTVREFSLWKELSPYEKPVDRKQWIGAPTDTNAFYVAPFNLFEFLAGILRPPFFAASWPPFLFYGAIGAVTGHELSHGFDDQGQQFDINGNRKQWWTDESIANFNDLTQCFVDQYDNYKLQGFMINGGLTLGENIADNGGLHTAYQAYKIVTNGTEGGSIGVYSRDQLFFVSFAQLYCSQSTDDALQSAILTDPHSPGPIRVLGTLSNSEEFATAFKCASGAGMNPTTKCELW